MGHFNMDTPQKKSRPLFLRIILWSLGVLVVVLIAGGIYVRSWLNGYLESDAFRKLIGDATSKQLKARCEYAPFHFSLMRISTDSFKAQGTAQAAFSTLELDKFHTLLNPGALWDRRLEIDEVSIDRLLVSLGHTGAPSVPESELGLDKPVSAKEEKAQPTNSAAARYAPKLDLRKVVVKDTNLLWGENTAQAGAVKNTKVTVTPEDAAWNVLLAGGMISQKGGPDLKLDHIKLHYLAPLVTINDGLLVFPPGGNIALGGEVNLEKKIAVTVKINGIPVTPFLPPSSQSQFHGKVFADVKVNGPMPVTTSPEVSGFAHFEDASVKGYSGLSFLTKIFRMPSLDVIPLHRVSADFVYAGEKITVTNLDVESHGLVAAQGGFVIRGSNINGTFQVGVPHKLIMWLPMLESQVFKASHGGYMWTTVHVSGPLKSPKEDLTPRVEMAIATGAVDLVTGAIKNVPKVPDAAKKMIGGDGGKKALEGLGKSLFKQP